MIEQNLGEVDRVMRQKATRIAQRCGTAVLLACACAPTPAALPAPPPAVAPPPGSPSPATCEQIVAIEVSKRERRLRAQCAGGGVVEMTVALGRGNGPKREAGDSRTPEGQYRISGPPRRSRRFHRFIPFDYPSFADAATARAEGRLSEAEYREIAAAHGLAEPPPANTALGGYLGFHGEGKRWRGDSRFFDWTYGCIGLTDADVDFLADRSAVGTPVSIEP
jgi:murein L,D-transpeptidase YafK